MPSAEFEALAQRRKDHSERMERELHTINDILEKFSHSQHQDEEVDAGREELHIAVLRRNVAIETSYRDRKCMERELGDWARSALQRGEQGIAGVLAAARESQAAVADVLGSPVLPRGLANSAASSEDLLATLRSAIATLQQYGQRVLALANACRTRELSLDEFSRRMAIEVRGVERILEEPGSRAAARGRATFGGGGGGDGDDAAAHPHPTSALMKQELEQSAQAQRTQKRLIDDLEAQNSELEGRVGALETLLAEQSEELDGTQTLLAQLRSRSGLSLRFSKGTTVDGLVWGCEAASQSDVAGAGEGARRRSQRRASESGAGEEQEGGSPTAMGASTRALSFASLRSLKGVGSGVCSSERGSNADGSCSFAAKLLRGFSRQLLQQRRRHAWTRVAFFLFRHMVGRRQSGGGAAELTKTSHHRVAQHLVKLQQRNSELEAQAGVLQQAAEQLVLRVRLEEQQRQAAEAREMELVAQLAQLQAEGARGNNATAAAAVTTRVVAATPVEVRAVEGIGALAATLRFLLEKVDDLLFSRQLTRPEGLGQRESLLAQELETRLIVVAAKLTKLSQQLRSFAAGASPAAVAAAPGEDDDDGSVDPGRRAAGRRGEIAQHAPSKWVADAAEHVEAALQRLCGINARAEQQQQPGGRRGMSTTVKIHRGGFYPQQGKGQQGRHLASTTSRLSAPIGSGVGRGSGNCGMPLNATAGNSTQHSDDDADGGSDITELIGTFISEHAGEAMRETFRRLQRESPRPRRCEAEASTLRSDRTRGEQTSAGAGADAGLGEEEEELVEAEDDAHGRDREGVLAAMRLVAAHAPAAAATAGEEGAEEDHGGGKNGSTSASDNERVSGAGDWHDRPLELEDALQEAALAATGGGGGGALRETLSGRIVRVADRATQCALQPVSADTAAAATSLPRQRRTPRSSCAPTHHNQHSRRPTTSPRPSPAELARIAQMLERGRERKEKELERQQALIDTQNAEHCRRFVRDLHQPTTAGGIPPQHFPAPPPSLSAGQRISTIVDRGDVASVAHTVERATAVDACKAARHADVPGRHGGALFSRARPHTARARSVACDLGGARLTPRGVEVAASGAAAAAAAAAGDGPVAGEGSAEAHHRRSRRQPFQVPRAPSLPPPQHHPEMYFAN